MPATNTELQVNRDGHVVGLTLNRPAKRNALSTSLAGELRRVLTELADDESVRAVVIFGAGPTWCSGVDLDAFQSGDPAAAAEVDDPGLANTLRTMPQPCIAAINGGCITGGLELALSCDVRIASPDAFFADTHTLLGLVPVWGMTELLVRAVGDSRAREMSFTGNRVDAPTALEIGLISQLVPADELQTVAYRLAEQIAENDPRAVRAVKRIYAREHVVRSALDEEHAAMHELH
jgi:enoyl-CoA hydratase